MMKITSPMLILASLVALTLVLTGCTSSTGPAERTVVDATGILQLPDMFGSSLRITGDDGLTYIPDPFPYEGFTNGEHVAFIGNTSPSPYYPVQTGVPVELRLLRPLPGADGYIYGIGNITYIDLEGGFYGIVIDTGTKTGQVRYYPTDLDQEFKKNGIQVSFTAKEANDFVTISQWGTPVNVYRMKQTG